MTRVLRSAAIVVLVALAAGRAAAQPEDAAAQPITWTEVTLEGNLIDDRGRLLRLFEAELRRRPELTVDADALAAYTQTIGYQLVDTAVGPTPDARGRRFTLFLDPIVVVRWVDISLRQGIFGGLGDDEVRRRLRVRVGTPLPWDAAQRQAVLAEDSERIRRFLRDEGYFEAEVTITARKVGRYGARIVVKAALHNRYQRGRIEIVNGSSGGADLAIPPAEIAGMISRGRCVVGRCRFTYARFLADLDKITAAFQRRGYPSVRVIHDFDPLTSFDRRTRRVDIRITIDPRRKLDIVFEGNDKGSFADDVLARQLTFAAAGTADDVEVAASARALERYYQARGYYDVAVTTERVRLGAFDRVVFRIEPGSVRRVKAVRVVCRRPGETLPGACSLPQDELEAELGTRTTVTPFFGPTVYATTGQVAADVAALTRYYRGRGFEQAEVGVEIAPSPAGWQAASIAVAEVLAQERTGELHVRFVVDEGPRTVIERIHVVFEGRAAGAGGTGDERRVLERIGIAPGDPYVRPTLDAAAKEVADWYWEFGRPRARVTVLEPVPGRTPNAVVVTFNIEESHELRIGEVLMRGNFRTDDWVIRGELGFRPGELLTASEFTNGPRRLRSTNLFDAVKLDFIGLDDRNRDSVDVVVRVEERHDVAARVDVEVGGRVELGGSNADFDVIGRLKPNLPNVWGWGIRLDNTFTLAWDPLRNSSDYAADSTLRLPRWLARRLTRWSFDTELGAFYRNEETERFGELVSAGASFAISRSWERPRTEHHGARVLSATGRYDFRRRSREEELIRPPGLAGDLTTNPIVTRTGTFGFTLGWDQRRDAKGNLNPLAPDTGFRLEAGAAWAEKVFYGQDRFVKLNGLGQAFLTRGRVQLRVDGRYDHGIPLGGAVLLPEVERFFAGGDSTVRGFEEDRLLTEIIEEPVPPFGGTTQIKVKPAGGNIRALATLDAQVTVWRLGGFGMASALFTDAGMITNTWTAVELPDVRPAVGSAVRWLLPIGAVSLEYAIPLFPKLGDNPRGRIHFAVALRY